MVGLNENGLSVALLKSLLGDWGLLPGVGTPASRGALPENLMSGLFI